jgi:hypothetical protein
LGAGAFVNDGAGCWWVRLGTYITKAGEIGRYWSFSVLFGLRIAFFSSGMAGNIAGSRYCSRCGIYVLENGVYGRYFGTCVTEGGKTGWYHSFLVFFELEIAFLGLDIAVNAIGNRFKQP